MKHVLVEELLETFGYLIVLNHALADVLTDDLFNNLAKFGFEVVDSLSCVVYAFFHLLPKIVYELCPAFEVFDCEIILLNLSLQFSYVPPVGFLSDGLVELEHALPHVLVFDGVLL